jgi:glycosyltransferase involved in cell wall biosynthesis
VSQPYRFVLFGDVARLKARLGTHFELVQFNAGKYSVAEQLELPALIVRQRIDLFHSPHYVVPVLSRCPLVVTVHDLIHLRTDLRPSITNRLQAVYARIIVDRAVRQAKRVVVVSEATRHDVETHFPRARGKTEVIYLGADAMPATPDDPALLEQFRKERGLAHPLLLFVGNPASHKNLPAILGTVAELRRRGRDVQLAAVGGKPEAVLAQARTCAVQDAVQVLGHLSPYDLALAYRAADVLLFPSLAEGFGLPTVEAMAAGLAVVTSNISSLPEVVGDAAITVDPRDIVALADAVSRVLDQPDLRARLVCRGRIQAARFSWRACADAHLRIYEDVLVGT